MNESLRQALMDLYGARLEDAPDRIRLAPASSSELARTLELLRYHGGRLGRDAVLSRRHFSEIQRVDRGDAAAWVGAGVRLGDLEARLSSDSLSLGQLSPGAWGLELGAFLEGAYAGLRALPGGRLESVVSALTLMLPDGLTARLRTAPRRAMGPDLEALYLGSGGRLGIVLEAEIRCVFRPEVSRAVGQLFTDATSALGAVRAMVEGGVALGSVLLERRPSGLQATAVVAGSVDQVERDLITVGRCAAASGGRTTSPSDASGTTRSGEPERALTWKELEEELTAGLFVGPLRLYRLGLDGVIALGAARGVGLGDEAHWPPMLEAVVAALDPSAVLGGPPP